MNTTFNDIENFPFPCALFDKEGEILAASPEWTGNNENTLKYVMGKNILQINYQLPDTKSTILSDRFLQVLKNAIIDLKKDNYTKAKQIKLLYMNLQLFTGNLLESESNVLDVYNYVRIGIQKRTKIILKNINPEKKDEYSNLSVKYPEIIALILLQFAVNAEVHEEVQEIEFHYSDNTFSLLWEGDSVERYIKTSRLSDNRERWGMGFAMMAADMIGATLYHPNNISGKVRASLEVGLNRLSIPMALIRDGYVYKCTRTWEEETGILPKSSIYNNPSLGASLDTAKENVGKNININGWSIRHKDNMTAWFALLPEDPQKRLSEMLKGMTHERALWEDLPEPYMTEIFVISSLIGIHLGEPWPRVPGSIWNRKYEQAQKNMNIDYKAPTYNGLSALDPRIVLYFYKNFGDKIIASGDDLFLTIREDKRQDPFTLIYLRNEAKRLKISF